MIGLSVSLCVPDIVSGAVPLDQVEKIVSSTACQSVDDWDSVINRYRVEYWKNKNSSDCECVLRQLIAEGKVEQPRLIHLRRPNVMGPESKRWVEKESEIEFVPASGR